MPNAILYQPAESPQEVHLGSSILHEAEADQGSINLAIAQALGCSVEAIDILASGLGHKVYSVFDCAGPINYAAMDAVRQISGFAFDPNDDDIALRGPVLIVLD